MKVRIQVTSETPHRIRRALASVREVALSEGPEATVSVDGLSHLLAILPRPPVGADGHRWVPDLLRQVPRDAVGLVVAASIPHVEREALEEAGISWCDGRGALHLRWHGVLVHVDRAPERRARAQTDDTAGLGPAAIRALQVLMESEESTWTLGRLAKEAAVSIGLAHNVFQALERNRLVRTLGTGPNQRRVVTDRSAALDWLATIDAGRRRPASAATYLYARTVEELLRRFAERARRAGLSYAVTGPAASQVLGVPVLSNVIVSQIRVAAEATDALHLLGLELLEAEDAGRGMNIDLWTDTGELGTFAAGEVEGVRVAPAVRIWLDLARLGGRNEDAARLFREQVLERS